MFINNFDGVNPFFLLASVSIGRGTYNNHKYRDWNKVNKETIVLET